VSVEFGILGPLQISRDGEAIEPGGKKQRTVLAVLLLNVNEVVSTDRLIEALWGDAPPESAPKALQVHVSQLRKMLGDGSDAEQILVTRSPGYMLALDADQLDLTRFDQRVREGRTALTSDNPEPAARLLADALSLWRGQPLADFAYEDFAQAEAGRLTDLRLAALEDRIEADLACGQHAALAGEIEALIAAEPMRERPWGQLMLALYRSGRQADALDAYRRARETLVGELGIEPGKHLRRLHEAILTQDPELDLAPRRTLSAEGSAEAGTTETSSSDRTHAAGFVGRERELTALEAALGAALEGRGSVHLIGGEPGIGKSRLADEVSRRARADGARVLWGRCWEAGGAPAYWPWVQALRAHLAETNDEALAAQLGSRGSEVSQVLPELRERFPDLPVPASPESEGARFRLFDATAEFVKRAAAEAPIVLVLDDLHAADTPSLLMLRFIAGEIPASPVLILGTFRDVEVGPDHPLDATLNDLARQQAGHLIPLGGLGESEVLRLIEMSAGTTPSRKAASAIHRGTAGNPLFVGELVQLLVSENRLEDAAGDAGARIGIPRGVQEVIGSRLATVSDDCRRTIGVAAVLGREFDLEVLSELTQRPTTELLDVLDEAVSERIIMEVTGMPERLRFSHVLIRDVLYEELGTVRRRRLHDRAATALETLRAADLEPHLAELAHHFFEAGPTGDFESALEYARRAAERASSQLAYEEAARHYELALRVLRTANPTDDAARCELSLALAEARLRAGDERTAKTTFREASEIARRLNDAEALGRAALGYGGLVVWMAARGDAYVVPLLEEALGALPDADSPLRARLMARLSCAVRDQPDRERRLPLSEAAVEMARRLGDRRTLAYTLDARCISMVDPGSMERFRDTAVELVAVSKETDELEHAFIGGIYQVCSQLQMGDVAGAKRAQELMTRLGEELQEPSYRWGSMGLDAVFALFEGRFEDAEELIPRAWEVGRHAQQFNAAALYRQQRFLLHRERGGLEDCEDELRIGFAETPEYHIYGAALANLYTELGRFDDARAVFSGLARDGFEPVYDDEEFLASMTLLSDTCSALADRGNAEALYELLSPHAGRNAVGMIEFALGAVARPVGLLARTLGRTDEAIGQLESAIEMNAGMGARPWVAHTEYELGRTLVEGGDIDGGRGRELLEHALAEYRALGMTPWLQRAERALAELASPAH
jgi:DNA-binding SARP family transcriptional activator